MKRAIAAVLTMSLLGLSQQASAETLMDILCPKAKSDMSATGGPNLDTASTGSVMKVKDRAPAVETSGYPQAILWSLPYP